MGQARDACRCAFHRDALHFLGRSRPATPSPRSSLRIAHLADLHLGFRAYHRLTPRGVNVREADVADAFRHAVDRICQLRPDLVIVAGDIFHTVRPSNTAIADAFRQFSVLTERLPGTPVVLLAGNHDSPRSSDTGNILTLFREIDGVEVVADECRRVDLPAIEAAVLSLPHNALVADQEMAMDPDPAVRFNLLTLHGTVTGHVSEQKIRYVTEYGGALVPDSRIRPDRWDYVALGHYHLCTDLAPNMWYPGALERTSTNIWMETGEKGFLLYDTETQRADFHAVETRAMVDLPRVEAHGLAPAELDEEIRRRVEGVPGGIDSKIVRLVIGDVPRSVFREINHRRIREWKASALHFHLDARPPEIRRRPAGGAPARRQTLQEQVAGFLRNRWTISRPGLEPDRLVQLGTDYVDRAGEG
jgi:DNA repair protein SbcD/Mre11